MAKELRYEITTDPSKGIAGLKQFSSAAKRSMKDVDDSMKDSTTNAQKLSKVLAGMADDMESEMKKAAKAADALGKALGPEISQRTDLDSVVVDLKKMGLSFDEITADADTLAVSLKRLDEVQLSNAGRGMQEIEDSSKRAKDGVHEIGHEADQSRSVLANMVGNSTQDLGQLGGVAGTAGVAIGQLGEYAAEGGISLAGLASVAGPMAGLALVTEAVSAAMQIFADRAKQSKEDTAAWVAAIGEGGDAADNMARHLADAGQILADTSDHAVSLAKTAKVAGEELFSFGGVAKDTFKLLTGGFKPVKDITELLGEAGITVQQYTDALTGGAVGAEKFKDALAATNLSADDQSKLVNALANGQKDYASAAENSAAATKVFGDTSKDAADAQQELQNRLSDARDDWEAQKQAISDAADATAAYNDAVNSMEWKTAGLAGATKGLSEFADAQFGLTDAIIGIEAASDDFAKSLTDTQTNMKKTRFQFDLSTDAGRKNQKAMEDLARSIDVQVAPAFADSHGDFASFMKDADKITNQSLAELTKQFNLTAPQVEELKKQLGLTAGDWEAKFKLSGDEEARVKLGLIQGALTGLDKDTQLKIGAQITAGDLQGAVATAQAAFNDPNNQVNMPIKPQPPSPQELSDAVDLMQRDISKTPLVVPVIPSTLIPLKGRFDAGGTAGGEGGIAGERGPEILNDRYLVTGPTYIPPGTRVTSRKRTEQILRTNGVRGLKRYDAGGVVPRSTNVTINAAVIGSTFDVMYAVKDAVKRADRLLPRNP